MLHTSGHTVLVSGTTLGLCFLGMLLIPVSTIASMGLAAAVTVLFAILGALTLTPTLLLTFPLFFSSRRRYGLTCDGCGCACGRRRPSPLADMAEPLSATLPASEDSTNASRVHTPSSRSVAASRYDADVVSPFPPLAPPDRPTSKGAGGCWASVGRGSMRFSPLVLLLSAGVVVPFAWALPQLTYVSGVLPLMPVDDRATDAFVDLQAKFGVGTVFPNSLLLLPPAGKTIVSAPYLALACETLRTIADNVSASLASQGVPYGMTLANFTGAMVQKGRCTSPVLASMSKLAPKLGPAVFGKWAAELHYVNAQGTAARVAVSTTLNPFTHDGQAWTKAVRASMASRLTPGGVTDPNELGSFFLSGIGPEQMDGAAATFAAFPMMVGVTLAIVCLVIGLAFRSLIVPVRAVLCIVWMLAITFGAAIAIYQLGYLAGLDVYSFTPNGGALFWMSPCIAFSIVVGLGLDYDVFFMESVIEQYDKGANAKEAVARGLAQTGNIICAAGVIMVVAFGSLLICKTPALNQIGLLLCLGVLIDCFVTTKVIIPALMALIPTSANFWPRKPPRPAADTTSTMD